MGCNSSASRPKPTAARNTLSAKPRREEQQPAADENEGVDQGAPQGCPTVDTPTTRTETDGESPAACGGNVGEELYTEPTGISDWNITGDKPYGRELENSPSPTAPEQVVLNGAGELYSEAAAALVDWRSLAAAEKLTAAKELDPSATDQPPGLEAVEERAEFIKRMFATCRPPKGQPGWTFLPLSDGQHEAQGWTRWVDGGTTVQIIFQFSSDGSLVQQLASIRDGDVLEQLWGGMSWDMSNQHADGSTLSNWKERTPVIGKQVEVLLERFFCNCLDDPDLPCWVLAERSPRIADFTTFAGPWGPFTIPALVKGFTRTPDVEAGRVVEPLGRGRCRVTSSITLPIPGLVRWFLSDSVLSLALKAGVKLGHRSWQKVVDAWDSSGMDARLDREKAFYGAVQESLDNYLAKSGETH